MVNLMILYFIFFCKYFFQDCLYLLKDQIVMLNMVPHDHYNRSSILRLSLRVYCFVYYFQFTLSMLLFYRITHSKRQYHIMNIAIKNSLMMNKNGVSKRYAFFVSMYYASRILDVHQERCSIFLGSLVRVQDLLFLLI